MSLLSVSFNNTVSVMMVKRAQSFNTLIVSQELTAQYLKARCGTVPSDCHGQCQR